MILLTKYEKNIERLAAVCLCAFERAKNTYLPISADLARCNTFFQNDELNLYVNWYKPLELQELNAIIINTGNIDFTNTLLDDGKQTARANYTIALVAKSENTNETIKTLLFASRILREKLIVIPNSFFECDEKEITGINFDDAAFSQGTDNVAIATLAFTVSTVEVITDFDTELTGVKGFNGKVKDTEIRILDGKAMFLKSSAGLSDFTETDGANV
ncbi:MAG: hypothetical protein FWF51_06555 [Chitinivibrionia bacterium]|nr:hypothetical protein [Chitinivibrionia bacterium]